MKKVVLFSLALFIFTCCNSNQVLAQQDAQFSQYMFNQLYFNPSFAGVEGLTKFAVIHRNQWTGFSSSFDGAGGAPITTMVSMNSSLLSLNSGVGVHIVNDQIGIQNNTEIQLSYAYHLNFKNIGKLSLGVRFGTVSQTLDRDKYRAVDQGDILIQGGKESQIRPDIGAGLFFNAKKWYASLGASHLSQAQFDFGQDSLKNILETHLNLMGGYDYKLNRKIIITPSILVKTDLETYSVEFSGVLKYDEFLWGGLAFRQSDAFTAILGYAFGKYKQFRLTYAFDYIVAGQAAKQPTSHELMLNYNLPQIGSGVKKPIRTPRYRY